MARAESIVGREQFRGHSGIAGVVDGLKRVSSWLGEVLLGGGAAAAHEESDRDEWWKEDASDAGEPTPMVLAAKEARQAKLFDDDGEVSGDLWGAAGGGAVALSPGAATQVEVMGAARGRVASRSRGLAVTRARTKEHAATSAEALEAARAAHGAMTRQLWRSQSISSGRDGPRWLAVPQCGVLLPRYQLFDSADAVEQDRRTGRMTVRGRDMRVIRGRVWFV